MGGGQEKRQISWAEKIQIIYVDTPTLRMWNIALHSLSVGSA